MLRGPRSDVVNVAVYVTLWSYVDGLAVDVTTMSTAGPPGFAEAGVDQATVSNGTASAAVSTPHLRSRGPCGVVACSLCERISTRDRQIAAPP